MKRYVVLGASIAGINAVDVLRQLDKDAEIVMVSAESDIYSKCVMHLYMNGEKSKDEIVFIDDAFMERNQATWKKGVAAVKIDTTEKTVYLSNGSALDYDKLLIAVGSHAFVPSIEGIADAKNVYPFHSLEDCQIIMEQAKSVSDIVILGAGLVGVDVANGLINSGKNITLIDIKDHMLSVQLDAKAASVYEEQFTKRGVKQLYGVGVAKVVADEDGAVKKVILTDGRELDCGILIVAAGTRANVQLALDSGLEVDEYGLVLDACCKTSADDVYGAGDITGRSMIWPAASKEAMVAAFNMTGHERQMTDFFEQKATINIFDIPTMAYGMPEAPDDTYTVEIKEGSDGSYQKIIHKDGKIYGVILQKNMYFAGVLNQLISAKPDLTKVEKPLLDIDYADLLVLTGK